MLGLNKKEMTDRLRKLAPKEKIGTGHVFQYEEGTRLPSYLVLLAYARSVNISTDYLIDDKLELSKSNLNLITNDLIEEEKRFSQ
jgi:hypothetical protein